MKQGAATAAILGIALVLVGFTLAYSIMVYDNTKPTPAPTPPPGLLGGSSSDYGPVKGCLENPNVKLNLKDVVLNDASMPSTRLAYCSYYAHALSYPYYSYNSENYECCLSNDSPVIHITQCPGEDQYTVANTTADICTLNPDRNTSYRYCFPNPTVAANISSCTMCIRHAYTANLKLTYYSYDPSSNTCTTAEGPPAEAHCADNPPANTTRYFRRTMNDHIIHPTPAPTPPCGAQDEPCGDNGLPCCGTLKCNAQYVCEPCLSAQQPCDDDLGDDPCCDGLTCQSGKCSPPPPPTPAPICCKERTCCGTTSGGSACDDAYRNTTGSCSGDEYPSPDCQSTYTVVDAEQCVIHD